MRMATAGPAARSAQQRADLPVGPQLPQQSSDHRGFDEPGNGSLRGERVHAGSGVDERERGHQVAPLLGEGGGNRAAGGMADHDGVLDTEPVQRPTNPTGMLCNRVAVAGRLGGPAE